MTEAGRSHDDPEASGRLLFALALLAGALLRLVLLGSPDLFGSDEGTWAVAARNLSEDGLAQALALSKTPLGAPSGVPILFPAILSVMIRVFGPVEWCLRLPSAFAGLIGAFVLERIVRRGYGQPAGHLAGAFAALFPPLVAASRAATVEPTLVLLGLAGIIFGLRALEEDEPFEGAVAGAFFGLGFLAKGYAVGLFLAPLLAALLARPRLLRLGRTARTLKLLFAAFVIVGGSHLLVTAVAAPHAFATELATDFGASELAAKAASEPTAFGADLKTIVKTLFFFLPLVGVGVLFLRRPVGEAEIASGATGGERRLSHGALWGAYAMELLIVVAVAGRLRLSSIPVMPALAALVGLGGAALLSPALEKDRRTREVRAAVVSGLVVLLAAIFLMSAPDDPLFGGRHAPISSGMAAASICAAAIGAALFAGNIGSRVLGGRLATAFLSALLVVGGLEAARSIRHDLLTHRTGSRELADQFAPAVAGLPPPQMAFRAPEPEAIMFRLFRTGESWSSVPSVAAMEREASRRTVRFWAYRRDAAAGPDAPPPAVRDWLEANGRDVTGDVDARAGRVTGLRVFVPRSPA